MASHAEGSVWPRAALQDEKHRELGHTHANAGSPLPPARRMPRWMPARRSFGWSWRAATDMFATPRVELGSTVGGFTPGIDRCIAELTSHSERKALQLEVALPSGEIDAGLAEKMTVTLRGFCAERMRLNTCERSATIRSGLRAFRIGLPVSIAGLAITAGATKIGGLDDALRAVVDILGWTLAWVGLWFPFDKMLFYPLDGMRENRALATLRDARGS